MILGYDEAGEGPVLLLVHGFPLDRSMWEHQLEGLSDIRRVVAVDLRGRGKSPLEKMEGSTINDYADDVAETVDALGVESVDLAGLSMGGYVVFAVRRRHRDKVRSIVLIDTKAEDDSPEAKEAREKTAAQITEQGTGPLVEGLLPKILAEGASEELKAVTRKMFENTPPKAAAADALAMRDRLDSTPDLAKINVPSLVLHGEQDQIMPLESAKEMAGKILGAKLVPVPGAGHLSPLENPGAVNAAIREFLSRINA